MKTWLKHALSLLASLKESDTEFYRVRGNAVRGNIHTQVAMQNANLMFVGGWVLLFDIFPWQFYTFLMLTKANFKWFTHGTSVALPPYFFLWDEHMNEDLSW